MLSKREQRIAIFAGAVMGSVGLYYFVIGPVLDDLSTLDAKRAKLQQELLQANKMMKASGQATKQWPQLRAAGLASDPANADSALLKSIDGWAQDARLQFSGFQPVRMSAAHGLNEKSFTASAEGSVRAVASFLYSVETAHVPVRIRELELGSKSENADNLQLMIHVSDLWEDSSPENATGKASGGASGPADASGAAPGAAREAEPEGG